MAQGSSVEQWCHNAAYCLLLPRHHQSQIRAIASIWYVDSLQLPVVNISTLGHYLLIQIFPQSQWISEHWPKLINVMVVGWWRPLVSPDYSSLLTKMNVMVLVRETIHHQESLHHFAVRNEINIGRPPALLATPHSDWCEDDDVIVLGLESCGCWLGPGRRLCNFHLCSRDDNYCH